METRTPLAVVTGSSRGIGKGIALQLARAGYRLALVHCQDTEAAEDTRKELQEIGSPVQTWDCGLAAEFGPRGITCNCLLVGAILTERTREGYTPKRQEIWKKLIPVGRWGTPEEIGDAVVFLARKESSFVNGASLEIDGGVLAAIPQVGDFLEAKL